MSCPECAERRKLAREALFNAHIGKAAAHVVKGAAELAGIKNKSALNETVDAPAAAAAKSKQRKTTPSGPAGPTPGQSGQEKHDG